MFSDDRHRLPRDPRPADPQERVARFLAAGAEVLHRHPQHGARRNERGLSGPDAVSPRAAKTRGPARLGLASSTSTHKPREANGQIASFNSFEARKATFLLALIWIGSPVAGLRPMRAARLRTCRMPRPTMRMRSPFFK